jgi:hypothetical protein
MHETERFTECIRNILENVLSEDCVREGRMKEEESQGTEMR